jgi:hypothetical protein
MSISRPARPVLVMPSCRAYRLPWKRLTYRLDVVLIHTMNPPGEYDTNWTVRPVGGFTCWNWILMNVRVTPGAMQSLCVGGVGGVGSNSGHRARGCASTCRGSAEQLGRHLKLHDCTTGRAPGSMSHQPLVS